MFDWRESLRRPTEPRTTIDDPSRRLWLGATAVRLAGSASMPLAVRRMTPPWVGLPLLVASWGLAPRAASAAGLDAFSNADAVSALKEAVEKGASAAVGQLGKEGGFLNNDKVRIPLPDGLRQGEKLLRMAGRGADLDSLVDTMNRAAEMAVPQARQMLVSAARSMSVQDGKAILTGGEDAITEYFRGKTRQPLFEKFLPVVEQSVNKLGLARQYNAMAEKAGTIGLVKGEAASVQQYVTGKALDGLFTVIAEQEKQIRADPLGAGSRLIGKVFGAMR